MSSFGIIYQFNEGIRIDLLNGNLTASALLFKGERAATYYIQVNIACANMGEIVMAAAPMAATGGLSVANYYYYRRP